MPFIVKFICRPMRYKKFSEAKVMWMPTTLELATRFETKQLAEAALKDCPLGPAMCVEIEEVKETQNLIKHGTCNR